jgi:hypothetical protein
MKPWKHEMKFKGNKLMGKGNIGPLKNKPTHQIYWQRYQSGWRGVKLGLGISSWGPIHLFPHCAKVRRKIWKVKVGYKSWKFYSFQITNFLIFVSPYIQWSTLLLVHVLTIEETCGMQSLYLQLHVIFNRGLVKG